MMSVARRAGGAALTSIILLLAGCGGSDGVSSSARARLGSLVEQVRHAAEARDPQAARLSLTGVRQEVAADTKNGTIDSSSAAEILAAAGEVENRLALLASAIPATARTTTSTTVAPPGNPHGRGDKHKGGKGGEGGDG